MGSPFPPDTNLLIIKFFFISRLILPCDRESIGSGKGHKKQFCKKLRKAGKYLFYGAVFVISNMYHKPSMNILFQQLSKLSPENKMLDIEDERFLSDIYTCGIHHPFNKL